MPEPNDNKRKILYYQRNRKEIQPLLKGMNFQCEQSSKVRFTFKMGGKIQLDYD